LILDRWKEMAVGDIVQSLEKLILEEMLYDRTGTPA
jgi:hypothetical protein